MADRGNRRIQVFDPDGTFLREITIDVPVPPGSTVDGQSARGSISRYGWSAAGERNHADRITLGHLHHTGPTQYLYSADAYPGRIYKLTLDGKVVGVFGSMGHQLKQFGWIHEIACPSENEIYTAEILNWRVQKLILHPTK